MKKLTLVDDQTYGGGDGRAINRHRCRIYEDASDPGYRFHLSRCLDACPPYFEAYGPIHKDFQGILPRLKVGDKESWGDGLSWKKATAVFLNLLNAEIV